MIKAFKNPMYIYVLSFLLVFFLYGLDWSEAFPKLSTGLILFFAGTFVASFFVGYGIDKLRIIEYRGIGHSKKSKRPFYFLLFLWGAHMIQFLYFQEIPLVSLLKGASSVDYKDFGIKSFHVFLVSFNSFLIVYFFHYFLSNRKKRAFFYYLMALAPSLLIMNRGMFLIALLSSFFVFLLSRRRFLNLRQLSFLVLFVLGVLYIFGHLGNLRSGNGDPNYIPIKSGASEQFMESSIPKEFYWTYLYGASPLANFQTNVNRTTEVDYNVFQMALFEMTPRVISKRIAAVLDLKPLGHHQIRKWLTVGTVYSKSYSYAKWLGPMIIFLFSIFIVLLTLALVPKTSSYHVSTVAILSTLIFMNTFSNMFVFSGLVLQLIFPVILRVFENKKLVIK